MVRIRPFTSDDIDFAVAHTVREGWASGRVFLEVLLDIDPEGCFIAELEGQRVGLVTTARLSSSGWVGNLIVDSAHRRQGIGRRLMEQAIGVLEAGGTETLRLDADPPGVRLYESLGFVAECESLRFSHQVPAEDRRDLAPPMSAADLEAVVALDAAAFGDRRARLVELLCQRAESALVVRRGERVSGFLLMQATTRGARIGPCAAEDVDAARDLLVSALARSQGRVLTTGVLAGNRQGHALLSSLGFGPTPSCIRMVRGPRQAVGDPGLYFAIAGGAIG
jgi:ribosomal protein S18 acetylase RimI-like enzyme